MDWTGLSFLLQPIYAGKGVIFCAHRVVSSENDTLVKGNAITLQQLEHLIRIVRNSGWEWSTLEDIPHRLSSGDSEVRFACLTFDDGFRDNLTLASPFLISKEVPFVVFPVVDYVRRHRVAMFEILEWLIQSVRSLDFRHEIGGRRRWSCNNLEAKIMTLHHLGHLTWDPSDALTESVALELHRRSLTFEDVMDRLFLSSSELLELESGRGVDIGSHCVSHSRLSSLSHARLNEELIESRAWLENLTGKQVTSIAYPFGSKWDCTAREFEAAATAGYSLGVTTRPGNIYNSHRNSLLSMPRVTLSMAAHARTGSFIRTSLRGIRNASLNRFRRYSP